MSDFINAICTFIGVSMDLILLVVYMKKLKFKLSRKVQWVVYGGYEIIVVTLILLEIPFLWRIIIIIAIALLIVRCCYKVIDIFSIIKYVSIYFIILGVGELITVTSLMILGNNFSIDIFIDNWELWFISTLIAKIISLIFIINLGKISDDEQGKIKRYEVSLVFLPLLCTLIVLFTIFSLLLNMEKYALEDITAILILVAITMGIYTLVEVMLITFYLEVKKKNSEIEYLKVKNEMQYQIYEERMENSMEIHRIAHDLKNHLLYLESTIDSKDFDNIYLQKLKSRIDKEENRIETDCKILDILIQGKTNEMEKNNIHYEIDIHFLYGNFIEELDIVSLFGNLIDNAIEACNKISAGKKSIIIRANRIEDFIVIKVVNTSLNDFRIEGGNLKTTKNDGKLHGLGLLNICDIVDKYNGRYTYQILDGQFVFNIMLPIP